ncbi:MAG: SOS response-associated peptidase family protein [Hyphomonadaceae bacterium]
MCNHYRNDIRRLDEAWAIYGFEDFSQIRIPLRFHSLPMDVFPDREAAVLVKTPRGLSLEVMRWGFPPVPTPGGTSGFVTNVRNVGSAYWRPWLAQDYRCLVPVTAFSEWGAGLPKGERWFTMANREPFFLAGVWRPWRGERGTKASPETGDHRLFAFLTCKPNALVEPIHPKAMPVVLRPGEAQTWLSAPTDVALELQRPVPEDVLTLEPFEPPPSRARKSEDDDPPRLL